MRLLLVAVVVFATYPAFSADLPAEDEFFDAKSICLNGADHEGNKATRSERLKSCDSVAKMEAAALDAGYCWLEYGGHWFQCKK